MRENSVIEYPDKISERPFESAKLFNKEIEVDFDDNNFPDIEDEELDLKQITFSRGKSVKIEKNTKVNIVFPSSKGGISPFDFNQHPIVEVNESIRESNESAMRSSVGKSKLVGFEEDVDINDEYRKYNETNVSAGKGFFKLRYVANQVFYQMRLGKAEDEEIVIEANDRNVLKFQTIFLQKVERAILYFNIKKFEESYKVLLDSGIVYDESEFAEFLLTIKGFDKAILGDFLAKDKYPNKKFKILEFFCEKVNLKNAKILKIFRFLLTRINLPVDSAALLNIIDKFSVAFYKENKEKYPDSDTLYLMFSTILALNSMMYNKNPDVKVKIISLEEFCKMNEKVNF